MLLGSLIVVMMLSLYLLHPLIASDGSSGSMPSYAFEFTSDTVKKEGENKVISEGSVSLIRDNIIDNIIKFNADKVIMEASDPGHMIHVEMIGKVRMTKPGLLNIQCQRAQSDNFDLYIEFPEAILTPGLVVNKPRYWFDSGKISYE